MERGDEKEDDLMPLHFSEIDSIHGGVRGGGSGGLGGVESERGGRSNIKRGGGSDTRKEKRGKGFRVEPILVVDVQ